MMMMCVCVWSIHFDDCTMRKAVFSLCFFSFLWFCLFAYNFISTLSLLLFFSFFYSPLFLSTFSQRNTNSDLWWWYWNVRRRCGCVYECMQFMCKFHYYRIESNRLYVQFVMWCKIMVYEILFAFGFFCAFVSIPSESISISIWSAQMYRGKFISISTIIFEVLFLSRLNFWSVDVGKFFFHFCSF